MAHYSQNSGKILAYMTKEPNPIIFQFKALVSCFKYKEISKIKTP
jgi:hypothetical protein